MKLREYQQECIRETFNYLKENDRALIIAPPGCLSGDTGIRFNRANKGFSVTIEKAFKRFNGLDSHPNYNWDRSIKTFIRSYNGERISLHPVENIVYSGEKEVFLLELANGNKVKGTKCHPVLTTEGWLRIEKLKRNSLVMTDSLLPEKSILKRKKNRYKVMQGFTFHPYAHTKRTKKEGVIFRIEAHRAIYEASINNMSLDEFRLSCKEMGRAKGLKFIDPNKFHIHHINNNPTDNKLTNLQCLTIKEHKALHAKDYKYNFNQGVPHYSKVVGVKKVGREKTYDIQCARPHHNFVANNIVVHNSGKTVIFSEIIRLGKKYKKDFRALILFNREILVKQTQEKLINFIPKSSIGIYSASYYSKDTDKTVTLATIQSVLRVPQFFDNINLLIIDEVHHANFLKDESIYGRFISKLNLKDTKVLGLTATPFRGREFIYGEDEFFKRPCFERSIPDMIQEGHLTPVVYKSSSKSETLPDLSKVKLTAGEYNNKELEEAMTDNEKVPLQVGDALSKLKGRKKIVWACCTIKHAEMVKLELGERGQDATIIHSKQSKLERTNNLCVFEYTKIRHLISITIVSEGFDFPPIDSIVCMRPTRSPTLYIQLAGRGLRLSPRKKDCLFLDYGRVVESLGFIGNVKITRNRKEIQAKICIECETIIDKTLAKCPECGYEFLKVFTGEKKKGLVTKNLTSNSYVPLGTYTNITIKEAPHVTKKGRDCRKIMYYTNSLFGKRWLTNEYVFHNNDVKTPSGLEIDVNVSGYRYIKERFYE